MVFDVMVDVFRCNELINFIPEVFSGVDGVIITVLLGLVKFVIIICDK